MILADSPNFIFEQTADSMMDIAYANAPAGTYGPGDLGEDGHTRHVGGSNVVFVDGHVKFYPAQRFLAEVPPLN